MANDVRTSVLDDQQIKQLGAESLNDLQLGDAHSHSHTFCHQISTKAIVQLAIATIHRPSIDHIDYVTYMIYGPSVTHSGRW